MSTHIIPQREETICDACRNKVNSYHGYLTFKTGVVVGVTDSSGHVDSKHDIERIDLCRDCMKKINLKYKVKKTLPGIPE